MFDHTFDHTLFLYVDVVLFEKVNKEGIDADRHLLILHFQGVSINAKGIHVFAVTNQGFCLPFRELFYDGNKGMAQFIRGDVRDLVCRAIGFLAMAINIQRRNAKKGTVIRQIGQLCIDTGAGERR